MGGKQQLYATFHSPLVGPTPKQTMLTKRRMSHSLFLRGGPRLLCPRVSNTTHYIWHVEARNVFAGLYLKFDLVQKNALVLLRKCIVPF